MLLRRTGNPMTALLPALVTASPLSSFLQEAVDRGDAAGVVALVISGDRIVYLEAFGKQDVGRSLPMKRDSIFRIASMTKGITSVAAMMLVDEGKLVRSAPCPCGEEARLLATGNPLHEPGERWTCGPGPQVLGHIIEKVSNRTWSNGHCGERCGRSTARGDLMRKIILGVVAIASFAAAAVSASARSPDIKVTLLGTGCPPPDMHRFGPSILVEAGDKKLLFDAGRGALQRLMQIGVRWPDVQGVFLTHLHSDHVVGFPDLWLTGWMLVPGRNVPLRVWGPNGTARMMSHLEQAFEYDVHIRQSDEHTSAEGVRILAKDIGEGVAYDEGGVKVTAFEVDHAPIKPAFGYRIDYAGRSVVLSGDTRPTENLVRHARGVDLLVHEVLAPDSLRRIGVPPERVKAIVAHHTTPEQAAEVFNETKPRLAVYSHVGDPTATAEEIMPQTRKTYGGPLELGEDLMVIEVGEKIAVRRGRPSP